MTQETLRVDTDRLAQAGEHLSQISNQIPEIQPGFSVSGSDPLSAAIAAKIPELERPVTG